MALFDMKCLNPHCEKVQVDVIIKSSEVAHCKKCGYEMTRLIPVNTGFKLKGTGWARDSYGLV